MHGGRFIELKHLRHVADDEVAPPVELARVGLHHARRDLQESRFARAVAPNQADAFAFQDRDRGPIEHDLVAETHNQLSRARDRVWNGFGHPMT